MGGTEELVIAGWRTKGSFLKADCGEFGGNVMIYDSEGDKFQCIKDDYTSR